MWYKGKDGRQHWRDKRRSDCIVKPFFAPTPLKDDTIKLQGMISDLASFVGNFTTSNVITISNWSASSATITVSPDISLIEEEQ